MIHDGSPQLCANHPDRPAWALCMACHKRICQECATQWDGINYCTSCLEQRRGAPRERSAVGSWLLVSGMAVLLFVAAYKLRVITGVALAALFGDSP